MITSILRNAAAIHDIITPRTPAQAGAQTGGDSGNADGSAPLGSGLRRSTVIIWAMISSILRTAAPIHDVTTPRTPAQAGAQTGDDCGNADGLAP